MTTEEIIDTFFRICSSKLVQFSTWILIGFLGVLSCLFIALGLTRRYSLYKIRKLQKRGHDFSFIHPDQTLLERGNQESLPFVTVVMPCKGVHSASYTNWKSQIVSLYGGPMEFIFVVESEDDPAYPVITQIIDEHEDKAISVKVCVAGISWHNSQKIHNQIKGVAAADPQSRYIAFIDDDIQLHPGTMFALVHEIEKDPQVFVSTGYSFEAPVKGAPLVNYMIYFYRMINLIGFMTSRPSFAWGGCLLLRTADLVNNSYGIMDIWRDGGYSDDTIAANIARKTGRTIAASPYAMFPAALPNTHTFKKSYVNFVRRQYYVLDTYFAESDKYLNYIQAFELIVASFFFAGPVIFMLIQWIAMIAAACVGMEIPSYLAFVTLAQISVIMFNVGSQFFMASVLTNLCSELAPQREKLPTKMNPFYVAVGTLIHAVLLPGLAISVFISNKCNWAGVIYEKKNGRVASMQRFAKYNDKSTLYGKDWSESLDEALAQDKEHNILKPAQMDIDWRQNPMNATTRHIRNESKELPPIVVSQDTPVGDVELM